MWDSAPSEVSGVIGPVAALLAVCLLIAFLAYVGHLVIQAFVNRG